MIGQIVYGFDSSVTGATPLIKGQINSIVFADKSNFHYTLLGYPSHVFSEENLKLAYRAAMLRYEQEMSWQEED